MKSNRGHHRSCTSIRPPAALPCDCGILSRRLARDKYRLFLMFLKFGWSMMRSSSKSTLPKALLNMRFMGRIGWLFAISDLICQHLDICQSFVGCTCVLATVIDKMITFCYGRYTAIGGLLALPISIAVFVGVDG